MTCKRYDVLKYKIYLIKILSKFTIIKDFSILANRKWFFLCGEGYQCQRKDRKDIIYVIEVWFKWLNIFICKVRETYNSKNVILKTITMKYNITWNDLCEEEINMVKKLKNHLLIPWNKKINIVYAIRYFPCSVFLFIYITKWLYFLQNKFSLNIRI